MLLWVQRNSTSSASGMETPAGLSGRCLAEGARWVSMARVGSPVYLVLGGKPGKLSTSTPSEVGTH